MKNKILLGISKIALAVIILVFAFASNGPEKPLSIWLGFVIAFPVTLWGVIDFVKIAKKTDEQENNDED